MALAGEGLILDQLVFDAAGHAYYDATCEIPTNLSRDSDNYGKSECMALWLEGKSEPVILSFEDRPWDITREGLKEKYARLYQCFFDQVLDSLNLPYIDKKFRQKNNRLQRE